MKILSILLKISPFKGFNSETDQVFLIVIHPTMIWFHTNTTGKYVNWPLDTTVKDILKNQVQGEQVVPCWVNFRVAAEEAVTQLHKLLIPSVCEH
jgi:hypothetical protein